MRARLVCVFVCLFLIAFFLPTKAAVAQSVVSGEITGTVTDPTGAVIPNATITLSSSAKGTRETTTTDATGSYRFALLHPGTYNLAVSAAGFSVVKLTTVVSLGQVTTLPVRLAVGSASTVMEVTSSAPLLQTDNGNIATTYDTRQIALIPSPGQDLTNYAMTSPGVTLSTGAGYGNFTADGMPGTSNLYTVNGNDYNDPYLNLNNSGASNLLLGANEVQELTIVDNGYSGQYGRAAGANVNYITKSGSNQFHGNASWYWNGSYLNANDWFNNRTATDRPFANSNQWAGSIGGPIVKNKLFFFYDNEGLRYVLPGGGGATFVPTTAFANATLANIAANQAGETPFYTNIFKLYSGAPGINRAVPVTSATDPALGCGDFSGGGFGTTTPCAQTFNSTVNNLNTERLQSVTIDFNATQRDTLRFRYKQDRGVQATGTDVINPIFNANSVQPEDDGQLIWTHVISSNMDNQFIAAGLYYSAIFGPPDLAGALKTFPTTLLFNDGLYANLGGNDNVFPQGRNVGQYQFVDDFSWTKGVHAVKFGVNFRRNNITSFAAGPGTSGLLTENSMTDFYNGVISGAGTGTFAQTFANSTEQPIAYYSLGLYIQDEWRITSSLKLTAALRADSNSNEVCQRNCFSRPAGSFLDLSHNVNTPYNAAVVTGLHQVFPSMEAVAWGPRGSLAWSPFGRQDLVIRGGVGLFSDLYPGFLADRFIRNLPNVSIFTVQPTGSTKYPISPAVPGNVFAQAAGSNTAFDAAYASGGTLASLQAAFPSFTPPNLSTVVNSINNPKYVEWNLEGEKAFGSNTSLNVNYVGNHGYGLFISNAGYNSFCSLAKCPTGFGGLPSSAPDQRFRVVNELLQKGRSNYNGVTATLNRRFSHGFQGSFNYTYSHSLDDVSNGGLLPYNTNNGANSFRTVIDPLNLDRLNYSNSDYDFPHSMSASYYWLLPYHFANNMLNEALGGWGIAGTFFAKSGEPFSVYSTTVRQKLGNGTSDVVLGDYLSGPTTCSAPGASVQCLTKSQFTSAANQFDFGNHPRNFFRGPAYFNADFSVQKNFKVTEALSFTMGANAFNVFNHPNFDNPIGNLTSGRFGQIFQTVTPPNSPYGNFQGATVSGRVLQLDLKLQF